MNKNNPKIEGPFHGGGNRYFDYLNKCGSCGEKIGIRGGKEDKEYRRTLNEETFNKTGGREGRIYYCVPCGERLVKSEVEQENREREGYNNEKKQNTQKIIESCLAEISLLEQKATSGNEAGTVEDYKKIKNVEKRIKGLDNFEEMKGDIEKLKNSCRDLIETYISPKDRDKGDNGKRTIKHTCCLVKDIKFDEEDNQFYCNYCWEVGDYWEVESSRFLISLKNYHIDKLNKMMLDNGVSATELNSSNYRSLLTVPDIILTQKGIRDAYQNAEQDLQTYLKNKKGIIIKTEREREREREQIQTKQQQLRTQIMNLESQPTKTPEQEAELARKRQELEELERKKRELEKKKQREQGQETPKDSGLGWKVGIGVLAGVGLVVLGVILVRRRKKKRSI